MARRRNSAFDDLISIASVLPWWVGIAIAAVAWFGFGMLIAAEPDPALDGTDLGRVTVHGMRVSLYTLARYVIPIAFVVGAIMSFAGRRRRAGLLRKVRVNPNDEEIKDLTWRDFELVVSEAFRARGYQVSERGGAGADGGIDIEVRKNGECFLVQCKHWKARNVGVGVVRELFGVIAAERAAGGFVICSGTFTRDAENFARGKSIELIGADGLALLFEDGAARLPATPGIEREEPAAQTTVVCPDCGSSMVKRTARKGPSKGASFWGCQRFPQCRGTRPLACFENR